MPHILIIAGDINARLCGKFGCISNDGAWGGSVGYVVYHRLNGAPTLSNADVHPKSCS